MRDPLSQWQFIEATAADMGVNAEARRKWRERGKVPHKYRLALLEAAAEAKVRLDAAIFDDVPAGAGKAA